ncbi:hypothetical protein, partial [Caballeronia sp. M23-90]
MKIRLLIAQAAIVMAGVAAVAGTASAEVIFFYARKGLSQPARGVSVCLCATECFPVRYHPEPEGERRAK